MKRGVGMVLGKFMPPHTGHVYLVEFARAQCERLTVVVGTLAREPIPGVLRHAWMCELFPYENVVHLTDENPQEPDEHPQFWDVWRESLLRVLPERPDFVFASETYGERLAYELGAKWIPVDVGRQIVPIHGADVRRDPLAHWQFLPRCVRPYFVKRVCIVGPESTGKSTLAERLAHTFGTVWVPEYARPFLERTGGNVLLHDMPAIARGQMASEEALARNAERILFSDTDATSTLLWSELLFKTRPAEIAALADAHHHDLYLLTSPDVPFVPDVVRYRPNDRAAFFQSLETELAARSKRVVVLRGTWDERFEQARKAVTTLLGGA